MVTIVTERKSTGCLSEAMAIVYRIVKKGDVVGVFPDTSTDNNIPAGTVWVNKLDNCSN